MDPAARVLISSGRDQGLFFWDVESALASLSPSTSGAATASQAQPPASPFEVLNESRVSCLRVVSIDRIISPAGFSSLPGGLPVTLVGVVARGKPPSIIEVVRSSAGCKAKPAGIVAATKDGGRSIVSLDILPVAVVTGFSPPEFLCAGLDATAMCVYIWGIIANQTMRTIPLVSPALLRFQPIGSDATRFVLCAAVGASIHVIVISTTAATADASDKQVAVHTLATPHVHAIASLDWSPDGRWLASASADRVVIN
nr:hypothetical protein HK105_000837 [Polyrhizophydium stewartii]